MGNPKKRLILCLLTLLPGINIFIYAIFLINLDLARHIKKVLNIYIIWINKIYDKNKSNLSNPFENMIKSSELCELMNKNYWFFDI